MKLERSTIRDAHIRSWIRQVQADAKDLVNDEGGRL